MKERAAAGSRSTSTNYEAAVLAYAGGHDETVKKIYLNERGRLCEVARAASPAAIATPTPSTMMPSFRYREDVRVRNDDRG